MLVQESKARSWLLRAVQLAKGDNGDFWALLYKLESQYGNAESQKKVLLLHHPSPQQQHVTSRYTVTLQSWLLGDMSRDAITCCHCMPMMGHGINATEVSCRGSCSTLEL